MDPSTRPAVIRFAEFEADLRSGELRRQGHRLKLQDKPFQVLVELILRPGELVTREQLRQSLWPADTFVDFEHGLNTAVNKVRDALRDSAARPRFIETLPRRGYRFIGSIDGPGLSPSPTLIAPTGPKSGPRTELPQAPRWATRSLLLLIEVAYMVSYIAALHYLLWVRALARFSFGPKEALTISSSILLWCALGMPIRLYLISALSFDYDLLEEKFHGIFPFLLVIDLFWSGMTLFILPNIGLGLAFVLFVAAVYSPFAQRTLVRMAYGQQNS